jgi:transforming growth factor-beta-induced protein
MRTLKIVGAVAMFVTLAMAQESKSPGPTDVLRTVQSHKSLTSFGVALRLGGLTATLRGEGPFTVIAPADGAFASLPKDEMQKLMTSPAAMSVLLAHYVVHGYVASNDATSLSSARTLMGATLRADSRNGDVRVNGAKIVEGDIRCTNGVIHVVDHFDAGLVREAVAIASPLIADHRRSKN